VAAETRFIFAHNWAHPRFYCLIGLILFLLPLHEPVNLRMMIGYVLTTLYPMARWPGS